ncbi:hypothetical protein DDZ13_01085 [Coraliomargarita sinensis]|uniref:Uncharacterized protein n=1 Tax=Coraliomargarita sinensis TaxID=2174842 RepID=A0A317ZIF0_9BACT|nr:hypothetical protein [Coraliomargarita sinensis]PXA05494.1 hypothetical protein DDZ13_01085 [Coraliomargarita sinensis]
MDIPSIILLGALCGLVGAFAMTAFMTAVSSAFSERVDMVRALGSYFTGRLEGAVGLGRIIHAVSGLIFGATYLLIMHQMDALTFPYPIFLGIGFGFFHGLIMCYILMIFASMRHPIEEYRKATLEEGLLHLVGHIIFGIVVGLLAGLLSLGF